MRPHQSAWIGFGRVLPSTPIRLAGAPRRSQLGQSQLTESLRGRGPILPIQIGLPQAAEASIRQNGEVPGAMEEVQALVDTGASITAINMATAERLGLIPTGSVQVGGVTGVDTRPLYGVRVVMPEPGFTFDPIEVAGANLNVPDFEVLIGRNLLCSILMTYDGPRGQFSLTK